MSKLFLDAIAQRPVARRPLWLMRQAGRYLPEYRELRKEYSFEQLSDSAELACEVTLQPLRRFKLDAAIIFADLMSPVAALGIDVRFAPGPVVDEPLTSRAQIEALPDPAQQDIAPQVAQALTMVKPHLDQNCALIGFAGAPLSIAAYLVQGGSKKSFPALRALAQSDELAFGRLMERLTRTCALYMKAQVEAGADALQIFDSWGGIFSLTDWRRLIRPHIEVLLQETAATGVPRIFYLQNGYHLLDDVLQLPADAFSLDWRVDLAALRAAGHTMTLQGNLDPAILLAGPEVTHKLTLDLMNSIPKQGHLVNLGQGLMPETPIASVQAMLDAVHSEPAG
ncbi:MAG: uroporphyrinogen decarboxylase [Rickettsiales bacterium]|nr:uroporphyrinogen decarboxylase [Rickettsiales bacterium]|tara:strand:+ start:1026 stop:2042 length:1017 start_codon:yes stop_codon:yes gene_type:complete